MPQWLRENDPNRGEDIGSAFRFGLVNSLSLLSSLGNRLGAVRFALVVILWAIVAFWLTDSGLIIQLIAFSGGFFSGFQWFAAKARAPAGDRLIKSGAAAVAGAISTYLLQVLAIFLFIPVILITLWWSWRKDQAFAADQQEFEKRAFTLKPWVIFWGWVANDDEGADQWVKSCLCIALPGLDCWSNGAPPTDYDVNLPGAWYSSGYPVLLCTSEERRSHDGQYLEIRPLPKETTRSFVRLDDLHQVIMQLGEEDKNAQLALLGRGTHSDLVVMDRLGPLLNPEDRKRIAAAIVRRASGQAEVAAFEPVPTGSSLSPPRVTSPSDDPRLQFEVTLAALGDPHELWTFLKPAEYPALTNEAKMEHVAVLVDLVYWSIVVARASALASVLGPDTVGRRHRQLAVLTSLLLQRSNHYRNLTRVHRSKDHVEAITWLQYALLLKADSVQSFRDLLGQAAGELSVDLYLQYFDEPTTRDIAKGLGG